jgi:putative hydrolase of the HAD superfamily
MLPAMPNLRPAEELPMPCEPKGASSRPDFSHVDAWLFDLDNTLYPFGSQVLIDAEARICRFIEERFGLPSSEAWRLQKDCLRDHGSTLSGLVARFAIDPEAYLAFVNDIDVTSLAPAPSLRVALARLPGKRFVFTNNCAHYAGRVLTQLGISNEFHAVCDIRTAGFVAKPLRPAYDKAVAELGVHPSNCAMFDDAERNLEPAHAMGMTTVYLRPTDSKPAALPHIHHDTDDLVRFLNSIEVRAPL